MKAIRCAYEWWPQAVGVRSGWAPCPAAAAEGLRELVHVFIPAYRRRVQAASRRGFRGWSEAEVEHGRCYLDAGDCRGAREQAGAVLLAGLLQERCFTDLPPARRSAIVWCLTAWEATSAAERFAASRDGLPAEPAEVAGV